jgi:hypothetical protein
MLDFFCRHLMVVYRKRIAREFECFMVTSHSRTWESQLDTWWIQLGTHPLEWGEQPGRKRHRRGWEKSLNGAKHFSWEKRLNEAENSSTLSQSDIVKMNKDAEVGEDIIEKSKNLDWWNWSGGSTLIFWC